MRNIEDIVRQSIHDLPTYCTMKQGTHEWVNHYARKVAPGHPIKPFTSPTIFVGEICRYCRLRRDLE